MLTLQECSNAANLASFIYKSVTGGFNRPYIKGGIAMKKKFSIGQLLVDAMEEYCDNIIRSTPV